MFERPIDCEHCQHFRPNFNDTNGECIKLNYKVNIHSGPCSMGRVKAEEVKKNER